MKQMRLLEPRPQQPGNDEHYAQHDQYPIHGITFRLAITSAKTLRTPYLSSPISGTDAATTSARGTDVAARSISCARRSLECTGDRNRSSARAKFNAAGTTSAEAECHTC